VNTNASPPLPASPAERFVTAARELLQGDAAQALGPRDSRVAFVSLVFDYEVIDAMPDGPQKQQAVQKLKSRIQTVEGCLPW
jgi:hypothetical protein